MLLDQISYLIQYQNENVWLLNILSADKLIWTLFVADTDGWVVRARVSVTWNVLSWSVGHEFEALSG